MPVKKIGCIYSNKSPTRCNSFPVYFLTFIYGSTCFGRFPTHHQELNDCSGSLWFYLRIVVTVVLFSWSGRPAGPTTILERRPWGNLAPSWTAALQKKKNERTLITSIFDRLLSLVLARDEQSIWLALVVAEVLKSQYVIFEYERCYLFQAAAVFYCWRWLWS